VIALLFYVGLGALLTLEEAGVFLLPGDISLVAAGLHAAPHPLGLAISWLFGSAGMVLGASVLFHGVGYTSVFDRVMPERARELIRRHGTTGVLVARLIPGLRNATVFAAASARMPFPRFLQGLVPAALIWSGVLLLLGWFGGSAMLAAFGALHHAPVLKFVSLGLLLFVIAFVWLRLRSADPSDSAGEIYLRQEEKTPS
jgi:membrane protein DedA with SNARE-associated domain